MAKIGQINPISRPKNFCSIDASTNSLAFAIFSDGKLVRCGKINFTGLSVYDKIRDASRKVLALFQQIDNFSAIIIEQTIFANSPKTAAQLALVQGAILGAAAQCGVTKFGSTSPMTWQNFIGNKKLTKAEKLEIAEKYPDKSNSWMKNAERTIRKRRTIDFVNINYDKDLDDDDVADAVAIGHWAFRNWPKAFTY